MSPDDPSDQQGEQQRTLPTRASTAMDHKAAKAIRRRRLLEAQEFCQDISLENPKTRYRYREGMQLGTLPPAIEKALLDIGYGRPDSLDKRLAAALGETGRGLTLLLRKALTEDPLAKAKTIEVKATVVDGQPPAATEALVPRPSIVPPARPKRTQGKGTLGPSESELP